MAAATPAVGYAVAWFHEWGYARHFNYPTTLIQLDFATLLSFWSLTVFGVVGLFSSFVMITFFVPWRPLWILAQAALFIAPSLIFLWIFSTVEHNNTVGLVFDILFTGLFTILIALMFYRRFILASSGSLLNRLQEGLRHERRLVEAEGPILQSSLEGAFKRGHPVGILWMLVLGFIGLTYMFLLGVRAHGEHAAATQEEFPVAVEQHLVAVRYYDDRIVVFEWSPITNQIGTAFRVMPELNDFSWALQYVSTHRAPDED